MKSEKKCIDDFLTLGRYGFITILLIELVMIIVCGNFLFMVFGGADVKITQCDTEIPSNFTNSSTDFCASFEQQQCTSLTLDYEFYSINAEWLLICDEGQLVKQSTSYQMLGLIIGSVFWGRIADLYGRKVPMIICLIFCGSFGFASAFSPNLIVFTALRTIVSFFTIGAGVIANTFYGELLPSKHRLWLAFLLSWSPNFVIVAAIAYFTQTWRLLIVFISSISVPATLLIWYMSETPHFLMRRGKLTKAILTIQRFYRIDGKEVDMVKLKEVFFEEQKMDMENNEKSYSFLHLFCTPKFIGYSIALCFCCFELSIISYSMLFNLDKVSGSLYENVFIVGALRFVFNILSAIMDFRFEWLGRKVTHKTFCILAILSLLVILGTEFINIHPLFNRFFSLVTASIIVQHYALIGIISNEIFPTPLRNTAFALILFTEGVGTIMAPHFYLISSISIWFPPVVMIILVVTDLLIFHFAIPESKGKPIADKMPENHERFKIFADNGSVTSFINKLSLSKSSSRKSFGIGQELDNSIVE